MRLSLVLTHRCDLACTYCYAGERYARDMPHATGARAVERAFAHLAPAETLHLGFFGGEPLLAWDRLLPLARLANRRAMESGSPLDLHLTSNGTHLSQAVLEEGLELGIRFTISMDGLPECHDAFRPKRGGQASSAAALAAIERIVNAGQPCAVVSVVRPETVDRLAAGARFLADRGVQTWVPSLDASATWAPRHRPLLTRAIGELRALYVERFPALGITWIETHAAVLEGATRPRCGVGDGEVAVAPSGRVYPCERLVGDDGPEAQRLALGHVADGEGPLRATRDREAPTGCAPCATQSACANTCACFNLARTGNVDQPDGLRCLLERTSRSEALRALDEIRGRALRRMPRRLPTVRGVSRV